MSHVIDKTLVSPVLFKLQGYATHVQFQVQPLIEHQDFLGGKGMGKIVSMSRKSNAKIQLVPASECICHLLHSSRN
jgi:hypothetical protein